QARFKSLCGEGAEIGHCCEWTARVILTGQRLGEGADQWGQDMPESLTDEPSTVAPEVETKRKTTWPRILLILVGVIVALGAWNATVFLPARSALADEDTHSVMVYRRWLVSPNQIVFDVRSASNRGSMADMDRLLFKTADAFKDRH